MAIVLRWAQRASGVLALSVAFAVCASACTASRWDTSEIDNPTTTVAVEYTSDVAGVTASITALLSGSVGDLNEWTAPEDQAACAAQRLVNRLTLERLLELNFEPNLASLALDYRPEERVAAVNILVGCIDFADGLVSMLTSYRKVESAQAQCLAEGVVRLQLDRDLAGALLDGAEPDPLASGNRYGAGFAGLATDCMEVEDLLPNGPLPPMPDPSYSFEATTIPPTTSPSGLEGVQPGGPLDSSSVTTTTR